jgi:hypothetical protein
MIAIAVPNGISACIGDANMLGAAKLPLLVIRRNIVGPKSDPAIIGIIESIVNRETTADFENIKNMNSTGVYVNTEKNALARRIVLVFIGNVEVKFMDTNSELSNSIETNMDKNPPIRIPLMTR